MRHHFAGFSPLAAAAAGGGADGVAVALAGVDAVFGFLAFLVLTVFWVLAVFGASEDVTAGASAAFVDFAAGAGAGATAGAAAGADAGAGACCANAVTAKAVANRAVKSLFILECSFEALGSDAESPRRRP